MRRLLYVCVLASAPLAAGQVPVRVATWNIQWVGTPGSAEHEAALAVIQRVDADVLGLNEIASDADAEDLRTLAFEAGYPHVAVPSSNPFGALRNAVISRMSFAEMPVFHTSPALSGDAMANDITRWVVEAAFDFPGAQRFHVFSQHWQAGSGLAPAFRRDVESLRIRQALEGLDLEADAVVVLGDVNHDIEDMIRPSWMALPTNDLPQSFRLGADLAALLPSPGILRQPFFNLGVREDLFEVDAFQLDGDPGTGPEGQDLHRNRLDYVFVSGPIADRGFASEVYDSQDEGLPGGLQKVAPPPAFEASRLASDHLLVFADILLPYAVICGDLLINGVLDSADVTRLRDALVDPENSSLTPESRDRCPRAGPDAGCDLVDLAVLRRGVEATGLLPAIADYCAVSS